MTAYFRAVSIGSAVPRLDYETSVHSVFAKAVNLQAARGGTLLTLLSSGEADLPQGIRLNTPKGFSFERLPIGPRAICKDGILDLGSSLTVDLRQGRTWECDLPRLEADLTRPAVAAAWLEASRALTERRARSPCTIDADSFSAPFPTHQSQLDQQIDWAVSAILRATANYDVAGMEELGALVGLGAGLTPAGDDLLTGYLAGLSCATRGKLDRSAFLAAIGKLVVRYLPRTNDISRTYLGLAARGQVSSLLVDLAAAICRGETGFRLLGHAEAAMRVGHTSGMEAVSGLLLGLAVWDAPHLFARGACPSRL